MANPPLLEHFSQSVVEESEDGGVLVDPFSGDCWTCGKTMPLSLFAFSCERCRCCDVCGRDGWTARKRCSQCKRRLCSMCNNLAPRAASRSGVSSSSFLPNIVLRLFRCWRCKKCISTARHNGSQSNKLD